MPGQYARGKVWDVNLDPVVGSETGKCRPCVIIQNDIGNKYAPTVIVAVITDSANVQKRYPVDVYVSKGTAGLALDSVIMCSQIRTVDKKRLINHRGKMLPRVMDEVDKALKISLSLPR